MIPKVRRNGNCTIIGDHILIFGGSDSRKRYRDCISYSISKCINFTDLFIFDLGKESFQEFNVKNEITSDCYFFVSYKDKIIFGQDFKLYYLEKRNENDIQASKKTKVFHEKLNKFYQEKPLADLTFIVEGKDIPAHKTLLAAKYPYFCDMFMSLFLGYS